MLHGRTVRSAKLWSWLLTAAAWSVSASCLTLEQTEGYGHLRAAAAWNQSDNALPGTCVLPPTCPTAFYISRQQVCALHKCAERTEKSGRSSALDSSHAVN
eukprot:187459-Chlamydomonas_euryale.AAC.2